MTSKLPKSIIDHSGKTTTRERALLSMLGLKVTKKIPKKTRKKKGLRGLKGPWKHDFKNFCTKCNSTYHLQRHHITYEPEITAFLCFDCHKRVTGLNARGSHAAYGNKKTRTTYTNQIRVILWKWFLSHTWPVDTEGKPLKRLSRTFILGILESKNFKVRSLVGNRELLESTQGNTPQYRTSQ